MTDSQQRKPDRAIDAALTASEAAHPNASPNEIIDHMWEIERGRR